MNRALYEEDVLAWSQEQAALLRAGEMAGLDLENLAEEIESLGTSQRHEVRSRMKVLIQHLLKWRFQPARRSGSWRGTIGTQRDDLESVLDDSPSLRNILPGILAKTYERALRAARNETGLLDLPEQCPFILDQIMDRNWLPD